MNLLDSIHWANKGLWWVLLVPAVLAAAWGWHEWRRRRVERAFEGRGLLPRMVERASTGRRAATLACVVLATALLGLAVMRPKYGLKEVTVRGVGVDVAVVLDASRSMKANDVAPDRLTAAAVEISRLLDATRGNRVALVPFAGIAFVQSPLTVDHEVVKEYLRDLKTTDLPVPGTAVARALLVAQSALGLGGDAGDGKAADGADAPPPRGSVNKAIVLLSDGENFEGDPAKVADALAARNVRIYAVGVGTPAGQPIPTLDENGAVTGTAREKDGVTPVLSKLNEDLLKDLANRTGGRYLALTGGADVAGAVAAEIATLEKAEYEARLDRLREDIYQYFLGGALALMLVPFLLLGGGRLRAAGAAAVLLLALAAPARAQAPAQGQAQAQGQVQAPAQGQVQGQGRARGAAEGNWATRLLRRVFDKDHGGVSDALRLLEAGQAGDAAKGLADAAAELPGRADLQYDLALARDRQGQFDEALKAIDEALKLARDRADTLPPGLTEAALLHAKGTLLLHKGRQEADAKKDGREVRQVYRQAVAALSDALLAEPGREDSRRNLELAAMGAYPPCSKLDDASEPNDSAAEARFLTPDPNTLEAKVDLLLCPGDEDWFKLPLKPGETLFASVLEPGGKDDKQPPKPAAVDLTILDETGGALAGPGKQLRWPAREAATVLLKVTGPKAEDGTPYVLDARAVPPCPQGDDAMEPNDARESPKPVEDGDHGLRVCPGNDDWFAYTEKQGTRKQVALQVPDGEGPLELEVFSADGTPVDVARQAGKDGTVHAATLPKAEQDAPFLIRVFGGGGQGFYQLSIQDPQGGGGQDRQPRQQPQQQQPQQGSRTMRELLDAIDRNDDNLEAREAQQKSPYREYVPEKDW